MDCRNSSLGLKSGAFFRNYLVRRKNPKTGSMDCMIIKPSNNDFYWGSYDVSPTGKLDKEFSINTSDEGNMTPGEVANMIRSMSLVAQVEEYIVPGRGTSKYRDVVKKPKKT